MRNFIKLSKYQSFSKLAEDLSISQSTLSHQISQLEKRLGGVKLIDRTTRKFKLTDAGNIFLNYAEQIVEMYDDCEKELKDYSKIEDITITASTYPGSHILPGYIANFRNKHPNVNFKILINNSQKSINLLAKDMADFAGIGSFMGYQEADFERVKIREDRLVFVCGPDHELLDQKPIKFQQVIKYPFIAREKGSGTRNVMEKQFASFNELKINLEMNDNDSIISAVSGSNYVSILSELIAKKAEDAGLIKIIKIKDLDVIAIRFIYFIKNKKRKLTKLKEEFWNYILNQIKI